MQSASNFVARVVNVKIEYAEDYPRNNLIKSSNLCYIKRGVDIIVGRQPRFNNDVAHFLLLLQFFELMVMVGHDPEIKQ